MRVAQRNTQAVSKPTFSKAITAANMQSMIKSAVPDKESAARFTGTLISVVANNKSLQDCIPATIVASALRGEGMGLTIGQGYYVVPYGNTAQFILGYKGILQLAIATGQVADIDCVEVREGEMIGRSPKTKKPIFDFSKYETEEEEQEHEVIGYMAYIETKDGFFRYEYKTVKDLLRHAERYSAAFKIDTYAKLVAGELSPKEVERLKKSSPWYDIGGNQITMMKKTVLRLLLNSGYVPLAVNTALAKALAADTESGEGIIPDFGLGADDNTSSEPSPAVVEVAQDGFSTDVDKDMPEEKISSEGEFDPENEFFN